jgi:hypothetical protein
MITQSSERQITLGSTTCHESMGSIFATLAHAQSDAGSAPGGLEDDGCRQACVSGGDDPEILSRQRPAAETLVGWSREAVAVGLAEQRTGIRC